MISVLILTLNEEQDLPACLESVKWSDDILVVDSFSTDRTTQVATAVGVRLLQNRFVNFADQRNFGLANGGFKYDWVLHLDADERVTPELHAEMLKAIRVGGKEAYQIASRMMFHGRWLKHSGLYPWHQVRLGRRSSLTFVQVGHGQREGLSSDKVGTLQSPLIHFSFSKGIYHWVERHNRYSTAEAEHFNKTLAGAPMDWAGVLSLSNAVRRRRAMKNLSFRLPCRPTLRFFYMYFLRLGFLDGVPGYHYCCLLAVYEYMMVLKMEEIKRHKKGLPL